jgi:hypothetical protein
VRALAAGIAAALGLAAALAAAVLWTAGANLLDEDRFADRAVAALRTEKGRRAVADRVARAVTARAPSALPQAQVQQAALRAVAAISPAPGYERALRPALVTAHRDLLELDGEPVEVDLAGLYGDLLGALATADPRLVALLPGPEALGDVRVATGIEAPAVPASELEGRVPEAVAALSLAAALLIALALALSARPARLAMALGGLLALLAVVPAVLRLLVPAVAEDAVAPPDDGLARRLAEGLLGGWSAAALALAAAGAGLALVAALARR